MFAGQPSGDGTDDANHWERSNRVLGTIEALREQQSELIAEISAAISAIRNLIERIPPEHLR